LQYYCDTVCSVTMQKVCYIYGLYDPRRPREIRYVGKTKNGLRRRLRGHVSTARRGEKRGRHLTPVEEWILSILHEGVRLSIVLVEECDRTNWKQRERRAITLYRNRGHRLVNVLLGGDGAENGEPKLFCECGARRKKYADGSRYCPTCRRAYACARSRMPKGRAYLRDYLRSPKRLAWDLARSRTPRRQAQLRAYYRKNRMQVMRRVRSWYRRNRALIAAARHAGITLTEYRKHTALPKAA